MPFAVFGAIPFSEPYPWYMLTGLTALRLDRAHLTMSNEANRPEIKKAGGDARATSAVERREPCDPAAPVTTESVARVDVDTPPVPPWAELLVRLLDSRFVIPGTRVPVGLDALIGFLLPVAGDVVGALATLTLLYLGFVLRVPKVVLVRMVVNAAVDALLGTVPALGDLFDLYFRAGERNLALLKRHTGTAPAAPSGGDYVVAGVAVTVVLLLLAIPVALALGLARVLLGLLAG